MQGSQRWLVAAQVKIEAKNGCCAQWVYDDSLKEAVVIADSPVQARDRYLNDVKNGKILTGCLAGTHRVGVSGLSAVDFCR